MIIHTNLHLISISAIFTSTTSCTATLYKPCDTQVIEEPATGTIRVHDIPPRLVNIQPIYILDGKRISSRRALHMNPDKIIRITIVKPENAILYYGSIARDGVVYITTKKAGN